MKIYFFLTSLVFGLDVHATCLADRAKVLKALLTDAETQISRLKDLNKDFVTKKDIWLKMITELDTKNSSGVGKELDVKANEAVSFGVASVKTAIETIQLSIKLELPDKNGEMLVRAVATSMEPGIKKISEYRYQSSDSNISTIEKAKKEFVLKTASDQFYGEVLQMLQVTRQQLETKCFASGANFEALISGGKYKFSNCVPAEVKDPDASKWGGRVPADGCRHVVSCNEVRGPQDQIVGASDYNWVLDCKKRSNECPKVEPCAGQTQGADGKIGAVPPGGGSAR